MPNANDHEKFSSSSSFVAKSSLEDRMVIRLDAKVVEDDFQLLALGSIAVSTCKDGFPTLSSKQI
jgi:hypothetical protein